MKVKAKFANGKFGFYGGVRRRDGDVFELSSTKHFSDLWMVKVDEKRRGRKPSEDTDTEQDEQGAE